MSITKYTTRSGAEYLVDEEEHKMQRLSGPYSPLIDYKRHPDGVWETYVTFVKMPYMYEDECSLFFYRGDGALSRATTPVINEEVVDG